MEEEKQKLQLEKLTIESERNRQYEEKTKLKNVRPPMPDNSLYYQEKAKELDDQMRFYQEQRRRFSNQLKQYEDGQKLLEEENIRIIASQEERERLSQQPQYDPYTFRGGRAKTFYSGYDQTSNFPQRNTYTYKVRKVMSSSNTNDFDNYGFKNIIHKTTCPNCEKFVSSQMETSYVNLCSDCGKIKQV